MNDQNPPSGDAQEALTRYVREQHANMSRYAIDKGLLQEDGKGLPVWVVPQRIFLGKIVPGDGEGGYWFISGEMPSDHIDIGLATTARDAARHFALKWQMQSAQIAGGGDDAQSDAVAPPDWANVAASLARSAETLYEVVETDDYWVGIGDAT